jgi:hypothetical protein
MKNLNSLLVSSIMVAGFAVSMNVNAAEPVGVSCSISVDYLKNGALVESYQKVFEVNPGASFSDDFSTPTRQKSFTASTLLDAGKTVVGINYFNDVGVFDSVELSTKLTLHKVGVLESTSGSQTFSTSSFPQGGGLAVNVRHDVNYSLTCKHLKNKRR